MEPQQRGRPKAEPKSSRPAPLAERPQRAGRSQPYRLVQPRVVVPRRRCRLPFHLPLRHPMARASDVGMSERKNAPWLRAFTGLSGLGQVGELVEKTAGWADDTDASMRRRIHTRDGTADAGRRWRVLPGGSKGGGGVHRAWPFLRKGASVSRRTSGKKSHAMLRNVQLRRFRNTSQTAMRHTCVALFASLFLSLRTVFLSSSAFLSGARKSPSDLAMALQRGCGWQSVRAKSVDAG